MALIVAEELLAVHEVKWLECASARRAEHNVWVDFLNLLLIASSLALCRFIQALEVDASPFSRAQCHDSIQNLVLH